MLSSRAVNSASEKFVRVSALLILVLQNTALVLLTKFSYQYTREPYLVCTVVACSESVKLFLSLALVLCLEGSQVLYSGLRGVLQNAPQLSLPSLLHVFQNNLIFEGVRLLHPTVYMVCSQSKILTSSLFATVLLKTIITGRQAFALCLLVLGMILAHSTNDMTHGVNESDSADALKGVAIVFMASITSGFAGTYLEKIYKEQKTGGLNSIWVRNMQLACLSLPIAVLNAVWKEGTAMLANGMFTGYDLVVVMIIVLQAVGGLVVAAVMRHASNVLKCFAVSISICNCILATNYVFPDDEYEIGLHQALGILCVIAATFIYSK